MTAGEFRLLEESELDFEAPSASEAEQILERFVTTAAEYGVEEARSRALLADVTPAVRDAEPLAGTHPTILYVGAAWVSDPLTAAYLASHGFVVAAVPNNGRMTATSIEFSPNPLTLDTGIDDAGYAWSLMRREPLADTDRMGIYAFSATSLHALLWQMRDLQADAIVLVEGWERLRRGADIVRENVQYDPLRVRVPLLLLERAADEDSPLYAKVGDVVDSLAYAERTRIAFTDAQHGDFLSHPMAPPSDAASRVYPRALEITRRFFEAQLEDDREAARWMGALGDDPGITVQRSVPVAVAPSEEEIFRLAETDPQAAASLVAELSNRVDRPLFREHVLARAAAFTESPADRVVLWRLIARAYPASSNAWLRLGTSLAEAGRPEDAREALHAALTLVPDDPSLNPAEREERTRRIEERLRGLSGSGLP
jgi:tetratricopeptide (TPR) repeat protein